MPVYYLTADDLRSAVDGTDSGLGTCAQLEDPQLLDAIARAGAKVSAYAGTTYEPDAAEPDVTVPDLIRSLTLAIAVYYGTLTYRKGKDLSAFDPVYLGYLDAIATLKDIASGVIQVSPPDPGGGPDQSEAARVINVLPAVFTLRDAGVERTLRGGIEAERGPGRGWGLPWR